MKRNTSLLADAFPVFLETPIPGMFIDENFSENSEIRRRINDNFESFTKFLRKFTRGKDIGIDVLKTISIISDKDLNKVLSLDGYVMYTTLERNLNVLLSGYSQEKWKEVIYERINELKKIKSFEELKEKFPFLYQHSYLKVVSEARSLLQQMEQVGLSMDKLQSMNRNERRKKSKINLRSIVQEKINYSRDINSFIRDYALFFENILNNINEINSFINKNRIDLSNLSETEYQTLDLLIAATFAYIYKYNDIKDDKILLYLKDFFDRNKEKFNHNIKVQMRQIFTHDKSTILNDTNPETLPIEEVSYDSLLSLYNELIKGREYITQINTSYDYSTMSREEILSVVNQLLIRSQDDYKKISLEELKEKISSITKSSDNNDVNVRNKVKSLTDKISFLIDNKPIAIIEGKSKFTNYMGYVYKNGYVAFDYISDSVEKSYGHAIYIIKLDDLSRYCDLSLSELRKNHNDKVIRIVHSNNWKEKLEKVLTSFQDAEQLLIPEEIFEIDMASTLEELDQLRNKLAVVNTEIETKIEEKKKKIKQIKAIDDEIKQSDTAVELYRSEQESLLEDEDKLLANGGFSMDFITLHELSKKIRKTYKRNPEVSLRTKLRTKDKNGFMHCDFCGCSSNSDNMYGSNKSTRMFEAHHIIPISEGGIDNLYNTACLCPGCHTRIHNYLRLRKILDAGSDVELPEGVLGEFITFAEWGNFIQNVRNRIAKDTPEYLPNFDELFMPGYKEYSEMDAQQQLQENIKFLVEWNTFASNTNKNGIIK